MNLNRTIPQASDTQESAPDLTVIIPLRCSTDRHDAIDRLSFLKHDTNIPETVRFLVVDDGSPVSIAAEIAAACTQLDIEYRRIDSEADTFSIGRARNYGAQAARTKYIQFQDVDLLPYLGFYQEVLNEIVVQRLDEFAERFLMFGVIYLTEQATAEYMSTPPVRRRSQFIQYLLEDDKSRIEKFSTGTSVTVWRRDYYLCAGGNDPDFEGWGYEDIEFMCRAVRRSKRLPLPEEFSLDYRNFQTISEYRGWKAVYRLFGDMTFQKGMVLFHAWHPVEANGLYIKAKDRNRKLFEQKLEAFRAHGIEPEPLSMPERGRSLILRLNPWVYNRWIAPQLGEIIYADEEMLDADLLLKFVKDRGIDRVVFHNPYATERMASLYRAVRDAGIEYLICERGALPDSIFFDSNGFNGESESYAPSNWRRTLNHKEEENILSYIRHLKATGDSLEGQPERMGPRKLRMRAGISPGRKVLFVPLQRPTDTVISYLAGPIGGYDGFISMVRRLSYCLPPDWTIVCKKHPLEVETPDLGAVIFMNDAHVNDLVELADSILLINSGVGVIGMIYEKPVLYAGQAFYGHSGIAQHVTDHEQVLVALRDFKPRRDELLQFLHYLVFDFYSFGKFKTRTVPWTDGSLMTATTAIDYYVARLPGCDPVRMELRSEVAITDKSILFDRYREGNGDVRRALSKVAPKKGVPAQQLSKVAPNKGVPVPQKPSHRPAIVRKLIKLKQNPIVFLRDSKIPMLRLLGNSMQKS